MENRSILALIVMIMLLIVILVKPVSAIGISPGTITINFEPNLEREVTFKIINNEEKNLRIELKVEGDLAEYIQLSERLMAMAPTEKERILSYRINLPENIEKPGTHTTRIIAIELPEGTTSEDTYVGAKVGVISKLFIIVPYPGKYAEAKIDITSGNINETTQFLLEVYNFGTEDIQKAKASISILDPQNKTIATIETNERSINSKDIKKLSASWIADRIGVYKAIATLNYDGEEATVEREFYVGNLYIELLDVRVTNFNLGDVAKFEFDVENQWNNLVKNVFAEVIMRSQSGEEIGEFKSTSSDLPPLANDTIVAYWDTSSIEVGDYLSTIAIGYADGKRTEKEFSAKISLNSIELTQIGATGRVITTTTSRNYIIFTIIGLITIFNILWFAYFKKKFRKEKI